MPWILTFFSVDWANALSYNIVNSRLHWDLMKNAAKILVLAVCAFLTCTVVAKADYDPMTLFQMLVRADIIVSGEITRVDGSTYDIQVEDSFQTIEVPLVLTVQRLELEKEDLVFDRIDITPGQQIVLFAMTGKETDEPLTPLGAIGEGEIIRDDVAVYLPKLPQIDRVSETFQVAGRRVSGYRVETEVFSTSIKGFFRCFGRDTARGISARTKLVPLCDDTERANLQSDSWLAEYLTAIAQRLIEGY